MMTNARVRFFCYFQDMFPYEWDRLRELLIGTVFGILLAAACIVYKPSE